MVVFQCIWVFLKDDVPTLRLGMCLSTVATIGLVTTAPALAQELVDVAALEARVEAAVELAELPAEPDWGVQDLSNSLPAVTQDAPEVPLAPVDVAEAVPEPRYHREEPQYRTEYQPPQADPASSPVVEPVASAPPSPPAPAPAAPVPAQAPAAAVPAAPTEAQAQSAPTIWIWIWNWSWVQGTGHQDRNTDEQYQNQTSLLDPDVARIIERIGVQIPVQIGTQTGSDITGKIVEDIVSQGAPPAAPAAVPAPALELDRYRVAPVEPETRPAPQKSSAASSAALTRPFGTPRVVVVPPAQLLLAARATPAPRRVAGAGKRPQAHRAAPRSPALPVESERFADSTTAAGATAGILLKSFAILIASLALAAFGRGRRLRLPSTRIRGLLGAHTDPFG